MLQTDLSSPLPQRRLGKCGLSVSALGFGGAPLGDLYALIPERQAIDTVLAACDAGVTLFDTSPLYGHGLSEHRIGAALRQRPDHRFLLSTKVGRVADPFHPAGDFSGYRGGLPHAMRFDYSFDGTLRSIEQSLLRLGRDRIGIALVHDVDFWTHGDSVSLRIAEALDGAVKALERLRSEGVIAAYGVGVNEADKASFFARETDMDCVMLAGRYSLLEQLALEEFLPLALAKRIGVMLGGVFNSGILATGAVSGARYNYKPAPETVLARVQKIERVCAAHGVHLRQAALHFALSHPAVGSVVLGAITPGEIAAQMADFVAAPPAALWCDLKSEGLLAKDAPVPA
jgi:D-threo-aldose 1-dehydrogenase